MSGACAVTTATRRYCSACRLRKCFHKGMKKELIRSVSAISHATSVSTMHRSRYKTSSPTTVSTRLSSFDALQTAARALQLDLLSHYDRSSLTSDDWNTLTNIRNAYEEYCAQPFVASHQSIPLIPPKQPYRSRIKLQRLVDLKYKYVMVIASFIKRVLLLNTFPLSLDPRF